MASLINTRTLCAYQKELKANGCTVYHNSEAGTCVVKDNGLEVLRALQKGRGGPWIVRFIDSPRIAWQAPK